MREFRWGLFIVLAVSALFIAFDLSLGPILFLATFIAIAIAYRYPYFLFFLAIASVPFLGFTISIPTGELAFGERAFGGSVDIAVAEVVMMALLASWAFKILFLWFGRRDRNWKPSLPLLGSYLTLVGAHLLSAFSPLDPDKVLVAKFSLRPVLFCYLAYVAVPVNFIRSRRKLVSTLSVMTGVGMFAALTGLVSLFYVDASSQFIRRAHPLPLFGVPALGDNHHLLAELLCATVLMTMALVPLVGSSRWKRLLTAAAAFQFLIGLLTFSRTGWIVFAIEACFIALFQYRAVLRRHLSMILATIVLVLIPLGSIMLTINASTVASSSNSTRLALLEIAYGVFQSSPWIGGGAGTFIERVGSAYVFRLEYGEAFDAHGLLQKLGAETGLAGLVAFAFVCVMLCLYARDSLRSLHGPARIAAIYLTAGALGAVIYQFFNTNHWTGKMWLPIGIMLAAYRALSTSSKEEREIV